MFASGLGYGSDSSSGDDSEAEVERVSSGSSAEESDLDINQLKRRSRKRRENYEEKLLRREYDESKAFNVNSFHSSITISHNYIICLHPM